MLVVTRRIGDIVMIGDQIVVKIIAINGNQVRLGREAGCLGCGAASL